MPTPVDKAFQSKNAVLTFGAVVAAASAWMIWGSDMFPSAPDPKGDPEGWSVDELRRWLKSRNLQPSSTATRQELVQRVKDNLRRPRVS